VGHGELRAVAGLAWGYTERLSQLAYHVLSARSSPRPPHLPDTPAMRGELCVGVGSLLSYVVLPPSLFSALLTRRPRLVSVLLMIFVHVRPTVSLKYRLSTHSLARSVKSIPQMSPVTSTWCVVIFSLGISSFIHPEGQSERLSVWVGPRVCRTHPASHPQLFSDALSFAIAPDPVFDLYTDNASAPLQAAAGLRQIYKFGIYSHCAYLNDTAGRCGNKTIGDQFKPYDAITGDMSANWSIFTQSFIPDSTFRDSKFLGHNSKAAYWMLLFGLLCAAAAFITYVACASLLNFYL
jgi:hypothetical protein